MKHTLKVTLILLTIFIVSQVLGLAITSSYIDAPASDEAGELVYEELPFDIERPDMPKDYTFIYIMAGVFLGTILILVLIKFKGAGLWKLWYSLAIFMTLMIALGSFLPEWLTIALTLIAVFFKVIRPNVLVHNISEIFVYAGIAAIFVPILNMFSAFMLLVLISAYDAYAVWKSKHMIKLAKFQSSSKLFAGLTVPYSFKKRKPEEIKEKKEKKTKKNIVKEEAKLIQKRKDGPRVAILGGGDIAFPLLFTGAVMQDLIMSGLSPSMAFLKSLIVTVFVTGSVAYLFFYGKKDRFYPAMPYISIGCLLGYGLVLII